MNVLAQDLEVENLENLVVLSQGSSQKSIGDVQVVLSVGTFEQARVVKSNPWVCQANGGMALRKCFFFSKNNYVRIFLMLGQIYSHSLERLFLKNGVKVPFRFTCQGSSYSRQMSIVVSLRFQDAQHHDEAVQVCPNHLRANQNQNLAYPAHVIQYAGDKHVTYSTTGESAFAFVRVSSSKTNI